MTNQNETAEAWNWYVMVVRNPDAYDPATVRKAAIHILASFRATDELIHQAASLI